MVIGELLSGASRIMKDHGISDPYKEALILLSCVLGCEKSYLFAHSDETVPAENQEVFLGYIEKRKKRIPVAYITGKAWFMSLEFEIEPGILIPRPETEGLAEEILALAMLQNTESVKLLDMCCGSGCIGISAAYYDKNITADLVDINPACVRTSRDNAARHNLRDRVIAIESNLFKGIKGKKYDIIASNPPYIPSDQIAGLDDDVRLYEPLTALDGGWDGMDFYKKLAKEAGRHLNPFGHIVLEVGIGQSEKIAGLLLSGGFGSISVKNDLQGIPRIITASVSSVPIK
ncbi:MAG: peptide chain release factor N(5)-glutamine methyltransferase [Clostridia bacterium]|nr:peptide chain release factor N(5)-glutamine methyltransferase [Clostridia bacterium]